MSHTIPSYESSAGKEDTLFETGISESSLGAGGAGNVRTLDTFSTPAEPLRKEGGRSVKPNRQQGRSNAAV